MSNYTKLLDRRRELEEEKALLLKQIEAEKEKLAQSVLAGDKSISFQETLPRQIEAIDNALKLLDTKLKEAEAEHIRERLTVIKKERDKLGAEFQKERDKWLKIENAYNEAQREYYKQCEKYNNNLEVLKHEEDRLTLRLEELEPSPEITPGPLHSVDEWLEILRAGGTIFAPYNDPNYQEANFQVETEINEIKRWAWNKRNGIPTREPECIQYYSKERLKDLTKPIW